MGKGAVMEDRVVASSGGGSLLPAVTNQLDIKLGLEVIIMFIVSITTKTGEF
jgi:hypothetical protein